jgi:signal transduction histidine kinase
VDDDPIMRELAAEKLTQSGYAAETACDGAAGFERLLGGDCDLVVSDLDMPNLNGFELTRKIRETAMLADVPVIVITASDRGDAVEEAFAAGATSFLAKPMNWTLFGHSVRFVLKASRDQRALRLALGQAEAGARFKDGLMSVMSHELRTPLNAIIGFGQLLGEVFARQNDNLHREYADYIVDGGKRLLNSVSDMLLASDARSGPIAVNDVDCTIGDVVELARSSVAKTASTAGASLQIALEDPDLEICCDRLLLARALSKLLDNAVKFGQRGVRIVVGAAVLRSGDLAILVKDTGPGIDSEKLAVLGQPFAQSDMSFRRSKEGLGLGVPLVQAIAAAHGATFKLDSAPGQGVKALFVLPAARVKGGSFMSAAAAAG